MAAYATLIGDEAKQKMAWEHYRTSSSPPRVEPDGSCPREEARTNSLEILGDEPRRLRGDLPDRRDERGRLVAVRTAKGIGVRRRSSICCRTCCHAGDWKKQQISKFNSDGTFFAGLAGLGIEI